MNREEISRLITSVISTVLKRPLDAPGDIARHSLEGWDSLMHINIVTSIEQEFKIRFGLGELQELKNVGEMIALMEKKIGAK